MSSSPPKRPSLRAGLAAFKRKEYDQAIAHFTGICQQEPEGSRKRRAQMGLILAHIRLGQNQKAISLCQNLTTSTDPLLHQWVTKTLTQLTSTEVGMGLKPAPAAVEEPPTALLPSPVPPPPVLLTRSWRQAGRAKRWSSLPKTSAVGSDRRWLWAVQGITAILFFLWLRMLIQTSTFLLKQLLIFLPFVNPGSILSADPTFALFIGSAIVLLGFPWLMSLLLKRAYQLEPLKLENLKAIRPESATLIERVCRQRQLPLPTLGILPMTIPVIFTYGNLPYTAQVVISQGVLDRLDDEELAALYATQLSQIVNGDFILMSYGVCWLQLPYFFYWRVAKWGDRLGERLDIPFLEFTWQGLSTLLANFSYLYYQLLGWPLLWLSRWRLLYSDAGAVSLTGNPNALIRALLKLGEAGHEGAIASGGIPEVLERFDLLLPLSLQQVLSLGNLPPQQPWERALQWDLHHPYRQILSLMSSHSRLGDRLQRLTDYARLFRLETELDLPFLPPSRPVALPSSFRDWVKWVYHRILSIAIALHQGLPLLPSVLCQSLLLGLGLRLILAIVGVISYHFYIGELVWLSQNQKGNLLLAMILISFSLIIMLRMNRYYPEIQPTQQTRTRDANQTRPYNPLQEQSETFASLCYDPHITPHNRPILRLQGKLLGRRGVHNGLGQSLILQTPAGLVSLRYCPTASVLGEVGKNPLSPKDLIGQSVRVGGWFRRTSFPSLEVSYLEGRSPSPCWSASPLFLSALAVLSGLWGAYLIWQA